MSYREHLEELERLINECQLLGPVIVAGDFNAHLGTLGGPKGTGDPNQEGILIKNLVDRYSLHVMSLAARSEGPGYTFWNSTSKTTVDYIIGSADAANLLHHCYTHPLAAMNSSDHLQFRQYFTSPHPWVRTLKKTM